MGVRFLPVFEVWEILIRAFAAQRVDGREKTHPTDA